MEPKKQQPPLSIEEQIENLKSLGLIIEDESLARDFLNDVSYFRFIKAYSLGLKPKNENYYEGITFNQLQELYLFNANFRQLLFCEIEYIEVNLRCRIANFFSSKYGVLAYKEKSNFSNENYHTIFLNEIQHEIRRNSRAPFIKNFQSNYEDGEIPFYALVEIFSFGTLSKFYKNMKNEDKKEIASSFGTPYPYLESWIESLSYVRNLCAHYGRLYNAKLTKTPILYRHDSKNGVHNNRIFGVLVCMKYLLSIQKGWNSFVNALNSLFYKYPHVKKETMGFPDDWKNLLILN